MDYILYSNNSLKCLSYLKEYDENELNKEIALPNSKHSSDHIPLLSIFIFKNEYDKYMNQYKIKQQLSINLTNNNNTNNNKSTTSSSDDHESNRNNNQNTRNNYHRLRRNHHITKRY